MFQGATAAGHMHFDTRPSGAVAIAMAMAMVETVFCWPGLDRLAFDAVAGRDHTKLPMSSLQVIAADMLSDSLRA